jgi:putative chitinase
VTPQQIATASGLANMNLIYVGQKLTIPGCGTTGTTPPPTSIPDGSTGGTGGPVGQTYVVVQGDTLFKISQRFGVPVTSIANANGISNINLIVINQQLVIPSS